MRKSLGGKLPLILSHYFILIAAYEIIYLPRFPSSYMRKKIVLVKNDNMVELKTVLVNIQYFVMHLLHIGCQRCKKRADIVTYLLRVDRQ